MILSLPLSLISSTILRLVDINRIAGRTAKIWLVDTFPDSDNAKPRIMTDEIINPIIPASVLLPNIFGERIFLPAINAAVSDNPKINTAVIKIAVS